MDLRKVATQFDYSQISEIYANDFGTQKENLSFFKDLIFLLKKRHLEEKLIVDLGSGPGPELDYLFKNGLKNITAVDFVPEFVSLIKAKYRQEKTVQVVYQDLVEYVKKLPSLSVACFVANFSLIHIPDEEINSLFSHLARTLTWNGLFFASFHEGTFKGMEEEPYLTGKDPRMITVDKLEIYMNYFTENELKKRLQKAGFKIKKLEVTKPIFKPGEIDVKKIWVLAEK